MPRPSIATSEVTEPSSKSLVVVYTAKRTAKIAVLWGYVFGMLVASSALSYSRIYKTKQEREHLAQIFGSNHASAALFGPAPQLQTVAGFTIFKSSMTIMVIGAIWGLLAVTRMLRGDEDAGRWELLLSGRLTRQAATAQVLGGTGLAVGIVWAITALISGVVGQVGSTDISPGGALFLATALVASSAMFAAIGALTSQLAANRQQAVRSAALLLGASYGARMVADAGDGLHWLVWVSPLGWVEQLRPLTSPQAWVLLPIGAFTVAVSLMAVLLAGRRDLGEGLLGEPAKGRARLYLLSGPTRLTARLTGASSVWWGVAVAICGLVMGIIAKSAGETMYGSSVQQVFTRLGSPGTGARAFLGIAFLLIAILVAFQAATVMTAAREEEASGRLDQVLVRAVARGHWVLGRIVIGTLSVLATCCLAGVCTWAGSFAQGSRIGIVPMLAAGVNTLPAALFVLGVGTLALGSQPRQTSLAVYAVIGWSALIDLAGGLFSEDHWVLDTSIFHHLASAPATSPHWQTDAVMAGLGIAAMVLGAQALRRRDLVTN